MSAFLMEWLRAIWDILAESAPYLLFGFVIAGFLKVLLPQKLVFQHLGKDDLRSVGIASLFGVPIPLCSCSVIPIAVELKESGASKGATTSFLISTPETGVDSIPLTWALMDPVMTVMRPLAALFTAVTSGALVNVLVRRGWDVPEPAAADEELARDAGGGNGHEEEDACCDHGDETPSAEERGLARRALDYAFGPLMADLTPSFVVGFALSALILVLVPEGFFEKLPHGWISMLAMLVVGIPIYVCATASTPVAAALMAKGLDPGAALVLLLAGPATNLATIGVVNKFLGRRVLAVYLGSIALCSLFLGWVVNRVYTGLGLDPRAVAAGAETAAYGLASIAAGVVLFSLLVHHSAKLRLLARYGGQLRRWCAPLGVDPTSRFSRITLATLLVLAYLSSGLSVVRQGEVGFRLRFGEVIAVLDEPGAYPHAPWPFERVERVRADELRGVEFGFRHGSDTSGAVHAPSPFEEALGQDFSGESEVVIGDENLLRITYAVHYRVSNARRYRYGVADADQLLRAFAESSLRRMVSHRTTDELLTSDRQAMQDEVRAILQAELEELHTGLAVVSVNLIDVHAPPRVHEAYRDVASALEDKQRQIRQAERYQKELVAQARASAYVGVEQAEGDRTRAVERARGEASAFLEVLGAQRPLPELARLRLRMEAAERALAGVRFAVALDPRVDLVRVIRRGPAGGADAAAEEQRAPLPWEEEQ